MSPSFSTKNGVRYRFYVSSALLRGRKDAAGSVARVAAQEIECAVENAIRQNLKRQDLSKDAIVNSVESVVVQANHIVIGLNSGDREGVSTLTFELPWARERPNRADVSPSVSDRKPDQKFLQAVVRAHAWLTELISGRYGSVEELAKAMRIHPKVVRQGLRLAFLAPPITASTLAGESHGRPSELRRARTRGTFMPKFAVGVPLKRQQAKTVSLSRFSPPLKANQDTR